MVTKTWKKKEKKNCGLFENNHSNHQILKNKLVTFDVEVNTLNEMTMASIVKKNEH